MCISGFRNLADMSEAENLNPYLWIFTSDEDLNLKKRGSWHVSDTSVDFGSVRGAGIASGLFQLDPTGGISTARREIAMVSVPRQSVYYVNVMTFQVDDDFKPNLKDNFNLKHSDRISYSQDNTCLPKITTGNFKGLDTDKVRGQLAVSWSDSQQPKFAVFDLDKNMTLSLKYQGDFHPGQSATSDQQLMSVSIAASDRDGKSYYLGAPVHLEIPSLLRADYVVQEPPKHLDYLPDDKGNWEIVRVSRTRNFYASFKDIEGNTFESTQLDQTNNAAGGSVGVSAKESVEDKTFKTLTGDVTVEESAKVSFDWESVTKNLNGNYSDTTYSAQHDTDRDDYIHAHFKLMDIWRFRIYGLKTEQDQNAFYEVILPGPTKESLDTYGCDFSDYYQPVHENGNILSYPQISDESFPEDKGGFKVCDDNGKNCQDISSAMSHVSEEVCCSESGKVAIEWGEKDWSSQEKITSQKWTVNLDFQVGFQAGETLAGESVKWYGKVDLSAYYSHLSVDTSFSEQSMSSSKGITVNFPSTGLTNQDYTFKPVVYATEDGTLKLAHAVDPTSSQSGIWWQRQYHGQPDLSLNLPMKFYWQSSDTDPSYLGNWYYCADRQDRSRMRRLFLLHNEPKSEDTEKDFVATSPTAGDTVYILTTVYNYSLDTSAGKFNVYFNYAEYDANLKDGDPGFDDDFSINKIGETSVDGLDPLEHRDVYVKWTIPDDLGGDKAGTAKSYVIYVTLDPENKVENEIHELYAADQTYMDSSGEFAASDPGPCPAGTKDGKDISTGTCNISCASNNQGYWPWDNSLKIFSPSSSSDEAIALEDADEGEDISIVPESLDIEATAQSEPYGVDHLLTQLSYRLKVKVAADDAIKPHREIFFYDNGKVFSVRRIMGLNPGENDFYCRWATEEAGNHTLKAVVMEEDGDSVPGNNETTLEVYVNDIKFPPHR